MRLVPLAAVALIAALLLPVIVNAQEEGSPFEQALEARERLERALERLQGDANSPRVNLGRTSLATVSASSVNGRRTLANLYYGIRNAFDAGSARLIGLEAYTLWRAKQLAPAVDASVADQEDAWVITMSAGETRVFEVTVTKSDGVVRTKPLARWVALSDE